MIDAGVRRVRQQPRVLALVIAVLAAVTGVVTPSPINPSQPASAETFELCPAVTDSVERLYEAYFLRQPDSAGRDFWVREMQTGRLSLLEISDFFAISPEFQTRYASLSNGEFVDQIYRNVLGRGADENGFDFWTGQLDAGTRSRGSVMLNFSESPEFVALTETAVPLAGYFSWYPSGTTFACGVGSFGLPTDGRANLDVFAEHLATSDSSGGWLQLRTRSTGSSAVFDDTFVPFGHVHLISSADDASPADEIIDVSADPAVEVTVVSYDGDPMPSFDDRSGWDVGARRPTASEFTEDLDAAVAIADTFWRTSWSSTFTGTYSPPNVIGLYDGNRPDAPFCGTFQLLPDNAFYCPFNDSVAWDVTLMAEGYLYGDAWVYLVVAHEWAHAIQARIDPSLVWVGSELQADCWAGAALFGSRVDALFIGDVDGSLVFEDGDQRELEDGLASLGNRLPWTDSRSHGNAEQRIAAFERGRDGGIEGCFPIDDGTFRSPASTGLG